MGWAKFFDYLLTDFLIFIFLSFYHFNRNKCCMPFCQISNITLDMHTLIGENSKTLHFGCVP